MTRLSLWHQQRADVQALLPLLATYLGHVSYSDTAYYLTGSAELLAIAAERAAVDGTSRAFASADQRRRGRCGLESSRFGTASRTWKLLSSGIGADIEIACKLLGFFSVTISRLSPQAAPDGSAWRLRRCAVPVRDIGGVDEPTITPMVSTTMSSCIPWSC